LKFANIRQGVLALACIVPLCLVSAFGQTVTVSPTALSFGNQVLGTSSPVKKVTLKNGQTTAITIGSIISSLADFTRSSSCPTTLAAGSNCTISVSFTPAALGLRTATLTITDSGSNSPQTVALSGTGVAAVTATPSSLSFGNQAVGLKSPAATVTVTNNQAKNLSISSITTNLPDYTISTTCPLKPKTLSGGASCTISVFFTPAASGTRAATLTISDNASVSPTVSLTGTGASGALLSIAVTPANPSFALGTTQQLKATGTYSDGSTQDLTNTVTWDTTDHTIAMVNAQGLATSVAAGSTTVTAASGSIRGTTTLTVTPATLVSIAVTPAIPSDPLGTTQQFTATGTFTDGSTQNITKTVQWSSDTTTVATISNATNSQGLATTVGTGLTKISAASGSITANTTLTVTAAALVSIAVTPAIPSIALGTTQQFTATGTYTDSSTQDLTSTATWASDATSTATINKTGLATSTGTGTATISATSGTTTGSTVLTVTAAALVSIAINPQSTSVPLGKTQQFTATGTYTDGTTQDLTQSGHWSSTAATVATISNASGSNGLASTLATGSTTIGITSGTVNSSATLTVTPAVLVAISISPLSPTIPLGMTQQFTATGTYTDSSTRDVSSLVTWSSSAAQVAIISNDSGTDGLATSAGLGTANITASFGSVTASTSITVGAAAIASITVTPAATSVPLGSSRQFAATAKFTDGSTQDVTQTATWASSVPAVATINSTGMAATFSTGSTMISALSGSVTGSTTLTVDAAAPMSLTIAPFNPTAYVGSAQQFIATLTYSDGTSQDATNSVTWSSSNPTVATVSISGLATTLAGGSTTIQATANSLSASTTLSVSVPSVTVTPGSVSLLFGGTQQFAANISGISNQNVTWTMTGVGTLSSTGLYSAPGLCNTTVQTATVTATSVASPNSSGAAAVTINASTCAPIAVSLYPPAATIAGGGNLTFSSTVTNDGSSAGVTWSMSGALGSLINQTQTSATLNAANVTLTTNGTLTATSVADPMKSASVTVTVSPSSQCGPPNYACSRSDSITTQLPPAPNVGGLTGTNTIVIPSDFNNRIVRVTDGGFANNKSISSTKSGGDGDNMWNTDSTLLSVVQEGGIFFLGFNPATMQITNADQAGSHAVFTGGFGWGFSRVSNNVGYHVEGTRLVRYTFAINNGVPNPAVFTSSVIFNATSCPGITNGRPVSGSHLAVGANDAMFAYSFSLTGGQGTAIYAVAYKPGSGCSWLNTQTGQVQGDWGATGQIGGSSFASFTLHDTGMDLSGTNFKMSMASCLSGSCTGTNSNIYEWQIGTINPYLACLSPGTLHCSGHAAVGYNHDIQMDNPSLLRRLDSDPTQYNVIFRFPQVLVENHLSWNNALPDDSNAPIHSSAQLNAIWTMAWRNEIFLIFQDGTFRRFAHNFISGQSQDFEAQYAIGTVSQDGRFFSFASDWLGTLGSTSGALSCTVGADCRSDVFVVELK